MRKIKFFILLGLLFSSLFFVCGFINVSAKKIEIEKDDNPDGVGILNVSNDSNYIDIVDDFAYVYEVESSNKSIIGSCVVIFTDGGKVVSIVENLDLNYNDYGIIIIELENQTTGFVSYVDGELSNLFDVNSNVNIVE